MKKLFLNQQGKISWIKVIRNCMVLLVLIIAALTGKIYHDVKTTLEAVSSDVEVTELREEKVNVAEGEPINVLLIGTDGNDLERTEEVGYISRSDTLMLVNLNPQNKQTQVLSIPRDSLSMVEGELDKINHAYAYGGAQLTIETVQDFLQIPIDYYATVDMSGLEQLIDAVGYIEVTSPLTFEYRGTGFKKGETREVNGVKGMNFARMRYDDPEGEVGRQKRQKIVIKALIDKILSPEGMANLPNILQVINKNVKTNINLKVAMDMYQSYLPALDNINVVKFANLEDIYLNEVFYYNIPMNERVRVANTFRRQSYLPPITMTQLVNPLGNSEDNQAKTLAVVINQYPTGANQNQLTDIINRQQEIQNIRTTTNVAPEAPPVWYPPIYNTYQPITPPTEAVVNTPPTQETPAQPTTDGAASTATSTAPEAPPAAEVPAAVEEPAGTVPVAPPAPVAPAAPVAPPEAPAAVVPSAE